MKAFEKTVVFLMLALLLAGLSGCISATNPDDSDQPWNVPPPNEGVPTLPGMPG